MVVLIKVEVAKVSLVVEVIVVVLKAVGANVDVFSC